MAWLSHADQSGFFVPRFDSCRSHCPGSGFVPGFGAARRDARHPGVAELLLQVADDRAGLVSRARSVHTVDEAEEHVALDDGRGFDHAPGAGVLRLTVFGTISEKMICAIHFSVERSRLFDLTLGNTARYLNDYINREFAAPDHSAEFINNSI